MPDKHPNTERWGGPGASHEDRSKPQPPKEAQTGPTNPRQSQVSGGGGERDDKHVHDPATKHDKTPAS